MLFSIVWRPAVACLLTAAAVYSLHLQMEAPLWWLLVSKVALGVVVYGAALFCCFCFWGFSGRPDGNETLALALLRERCWPGRS